MKQIRPAEKIIDSVTISEAEAGQGGLTGKRALASGYRVPIVTEMIG